MVKNIFLTDFLQRYKISQKSSTEAEIQSLTKMSLWQEKGLYFSIRGKKLGREEEAENFVVSFFVHAARVKIFYTGSPICYPRVLVQLH